MFDKSDLTYCYDGSFEGFLCCVFESYQQKEVPAAIVSPQTAQSMLFDARHITTNPTNASRVLKSIRPKLGPQALQLIQRAFLTCLAQKELYLLRFLRLGYAYGPAVVTMLPHPVVSTLSKAVRHLERESHSLMGFLRFSIYNNVLVAQIQPKNCVLPLLTNHFCQRYPEERFFIHDITHGLGLLYQPYQPSVIPIDSLELPPVDQQEENTRRLWQLFYDTIAIKERYNPKCRSNHMPKRYWQHMTEFNRSSSLHRPDGLSAATVRPLPAGSGET